MSGDEWILTYRVPDPEFGWPMERYEQIRVPVLLRPEHAVEIERVMHRLSTLAVEADTQARRLEQEVHRLERLSVSIWQRIRGGRA